MALEVVFAPLAAHDLRDILDYISADEHAAIRMLERFTRTISLLAEKPFIGPAASWIGFSGMRKMTVPPYVIYYRSYEERLEIVRILHSSRDIDSTDFINH